MDVLLENGSAISSSAIAIGLFVLWFLKGRGIDLLKMSQNQEETLTKQGEIMKVLAKVEETQGEMRRDQDETFKHYINPMVDLIKEQLEISRDMKVVTQGNTKALELNTEVMKKVLEKG